MMMRLPEYSPPPASTRACLTPSTSPGLGESPRATCYRPRLPGLALRRRLPQGSGTRPGLHAAAREYAGLPYAVDVPSDRGLALGHMLPHASAQACLTAAIEQSCGYISWRKNELSEVLNRNTTREPFLSLLRQTNRQFLCAHRNTIRQFIK